MKGEISESHLNNRHAEKDTDSGQFVKSLASRQLKMRLAKQLNELLQQLKEQQQQLLWSIREMSL
jgi:hypothetical protein